MYADPGEVAPEQDLPTEQNNRAMIYNITPLVDYPNPYAPYHHSPFWIQIYVRRLVSQGKDLCYREDLNQI